MAVAVEMASEEGAVVVVGALGAARIVGIAGDFAAARIVGIAGEFAAVTDEEAGMADTVVAGVACTAALERNVAD